MFEVYSYQYLLGAALSLGVSVYILHRGVKTSASRLLIVFGLLVFTWEIFSALYRSELIASDARLYFWVILIVSHLSYPIYLLTVLNIRRERSRKLMFLLLIPGLIDAIIVATDQYYSSFSFLLTDYGRTYRIIGISLPIILDGIIYIGYLAMIIVSLLLLIKGTNFTFQRKQYVNFLIIFIVFQVVGLNITNSLISQGMISPILQLGGIYQFLTFVSIAWVMRNRKMGTSNVVLNFDTAYSSFLNSFYVKASKGQLGEGLFAFKDFLDKSLIGNNIIITSENVEFKRPNNADPIELIRADIDFFEKNQVQEEIIDQYLRVLNAADNEFRERFKGLVEDKEDFLKKSDLIYGISEQFYLQEIQKDESLNSLTDTEICARIYKRILLTLVSEAKGKLNIRNILSMNNLTSAVELSEYGDVSFKEVWNRISKQPNKRQLSYTMESFNQILGLIYEKLLIDCGLNSDYAIAKLKLVFTLNMDKAVELNIFPSLVGVLATKVQRTQVYQLYSDYLEKMVNERTAQLKETQESLLKAQRFAAIGEAAAMVGHDLRNPLQVIVNMLYLVRKETRETEAGNLSGNLDKIENEVKYMNKIVLDLQDYSRELKTSPLETDLGLIIKEILQVTKLPDNLETKIELDQKTDMFIDPYMLKRVLTNLITNSVQAMPKGGTLTIRSFNDGKSTQVSVIDTGQGIAKENLTKIFTPLFTTKAKGQGLGLVVCKRIIEELKGTINVESEEGNGATFTITVPNKYELS